MMTFKAIEIDQYGIARSMLIVDQRVMPGIQSMTMRISESAKLFDISSEKISERRFHTDRSHKHSRWNNDPIPATGAEKHPEAV